MQFNPSAIPDDAYLNENSNRVDISDEDKKIKIILRFPKALTYGNK